MGGLTDRKCDDDVSDDVFADSPSANLLSWTLRLERHHYCSWQMVSDVISLLPREQCVPFDGLRHALCNPSCHKC